MFNTTGNNPFLIAVVSRVAFDMHAPPTRKIDGASEPTESLMISIGL